jgi:hypothetical protein
LKEFGAEAARQLSLALQNINVRLEVSVKFDDNVVIAVGYLSIAIRVAFSVLGIAIVVSLKGCRSCTVATVRNCSTCDCCHRRNNVNDEESEVDHFSTEANKNKKDGNLEKGRMRKKCEDLLVQYTTSTSLLGSDCWTTAF